MTISATCGGRRRRRTSSTVRTWSEETQDPPLERACWANAVPELPPSYVPPFGVPRPRGKGEDTMMASLRRAMLKLGLILGGDASGSVRGDVTGCETAVVGWSWWNVSKYHFYKCYCSSFKQAISLCLLRKIALHDHCGEARRTGSARSSQQRCNLEYRKSDIGSCH